MIRGISKYLKTGFYESRGDIFDNAILSFSENRDEESREVISKLMVESGFREEDNCYVDLEKEFFESGELDQTKSDKFKIELILYYKLDYLKNVFSGTTNLMTRITGDALKREGRDLNDYLPVAERRRREKAIKDKEEKRLAKLTKENKVPIYLYADGTMSTKINKEKCKLSFNRLGNTGGTFDFSKGYDPNLSVTNKTFKAAFNREGVWESIEDNSKENETVPLENNNNEINTKVELLFDEDLIYLMDYDNILQSGIEEEYFSVTGELYARREIDTEKSINTIKEALTKSGTNSLKTVILKNNSEESIQYYKDNFKEFITENTQFTTINNSEALDEIEKVKEKHIEEKISQGILTQFLTLNKENRDSDEIINIINSSINNEDYSTELNIYSNEEDMTLFLNQGNIRNTIDPETINYIKAADVPTEKTKQYSRSIQNLVNSKTATEDTGLNTLELLKKSYNQTVENRDIKEIKDEIFTKTTTLTQIIGGNPVSDTDLNLEDNRNIWLKESIENSL